jgi:hypothetical protein
MFKDISGMDPSIFKKVTINGLQIILEYRSGNTLKATAPNKKVVEDFQEEMKKILRPDQLEIKDVD